MTPQNERYNWADLNHLQVGKYGEYYSKMRMVEMGWQVYATEVDDRGIDYLIRTNPGKCIEAQVKSVRLGKDAYFFSQGACKP